jgi:ureidoglycolate lyase
MPSGRSSVALLRPQPLTRAAFAPFGEVLETEGLEPRLINFGNTQKFAPLAEIFTADNHRPQFSIYRSQAVVLPFRIRLVECHPLGSQAFYPLHQRPFPLVVAKAGEPPDAAELHVFLSNGRQGVNLYPGVWHHYQLSLGQVSEYLVIDRGGEADNYLEHRFDEAVWLEI